MVAPAGSVGKSNFRRVLHVNGIPPVVHLAMTILLPPKQLPVSLGALLMYRNLELDGFDLIVTVSVIARHCVNAKMDIISSALFMINLTIS